MAGRYTNIPGGKRRPMLDGNVFDSQAEANRYLILKDRAVRGEILFSAVKGDGVHPHFDFVVNGCVIGRGYTADFRYHVTPPAGGINHSVVEDVKGPVERDWPLRRDLFLALYPQYTLLVNGKEVKLKENLERQLADPRSERDYLSAQLQTGRKELAAKAGEAKMFRADLFRKERDSFDCGNIALVKKARKGRAK